jgi:phosphate transport system permease protein
MATAEAAPRVRSMTVRRQLSFLSADRLFRGVATGAGTLVLVVIGGMLLFLINESRPAMAHYGFFSFLGSSRWAPSEASVASTSPNPYGIVQFVYGTALTSMIAMLIAVPMSVGVALFITEIAPRRLRRLLSGLVDLLAAVPSVVYGFWGIFALIPALRPIGNFLQRDVAKLPVIGFFFKGPYFGFSYFAASIVLAIMILPIITAVCREVFLTTPMYEKEAALALGATRWEMIRMAVLPRGRRGVVGASVLGLGRALGETIAITMVIGNSVLKISTSVLAQGATMSSVIANEFTEANQPFHLPSLFVVGFWLLVMAVVVNALARALVERTAAL